MYKFLLPSIYGLMTENENDDALTHDVDIVDEIREQARVRMAVYQQGVARSYNKNVRVKVFQVGDWVLRKVFQNTRDPNDGKLDPAWEGPYQISKVLGQGASLVKEDGILSQGVGMSHT